MEEQVDTYLTMDYQAQESIFKNYFLHILRL